MTTGAGHPRATPRGAGHPRAHTARRSGLDLVPLTHTTPNTPDGVRRRLSSARCAALKARSRMAGKGTVCEDILGLPPVGVRRGPPTSPHAGAGDYGGERMGGGREQRCSSPCVAPRALSEPGDETHSRDECCTTAAEPLPHETKMLTCVPQRIPSRFCPQPDPARAHGPPHGGELRLTLWL